MRRKRQYSEFGIWASGVLDEINMTQAELAKEIGTSKSTISDVFTGRYKNDGRWRENIRNLLLRKVAEHDAKKAV